MQYPLIYLQNEDAPIDFTIHHDQTIWVHTIPQHIVSPGPSIVAQVIVSIGCCTISGAIVSLFSPTSKLVQNQQNKQTYYKIIFQRVLALNAL